MPLTPDTFANVATSTVQGGAGGAGTPLNAGDTACLLLPGGGTPFPTIGPAPILLGTLAGAYEIAVMTANTTNIFTLLLAQEGTTAHTSAVGTPGQQVATGGRPVRLCN